MWAGPSIHASEPEGGNRTVLTSHRSVPSDLSIISYLEAWTSLAAFKPVSNSSSEPIPTMQEFTPTISYA